MEKLSDQKTKNTGANNPETSHGYQQNITRNQHHRNRKQSIESGGCISIE